MTAFTPTDNERLRQLYRALQATQALIGGANGHHARDQWLRHERYIFKQIHDLEAKRSP